MDQVRDDIETLMTNFMEEVASGDEKALEVLATYQITDADSADKNEEKAEEDEEKVKEDEEEVMEDEEEAVEDEDATMTDMENSSTKAYADIVAEQLADGDVDRLANGDGF